MLTLRMNDGFDQDAYTALKDALRNLATAWEGLEDLPRLAVNVLVDIVPITEGMVHSYPEPVSTQITQATFELQELIAECVALSDADLAIVDALPPYEG
ncbi:hypothetical protein GCM10010174_45750 [Kutzneria viridogrisea]|uniref:Uncharacterized protein n=1 Tax=Kutzneria viridogrisea TaxID=47990 RepID=A0ABR6BIY8_9PSEU|nr:hypothetical protein [Kutzneria viridogrisea]